MANVVPEPVVQKVCNKNVKLMIRLCLVDNLCNKASEECYHIFQWIKKKSFSVTRFGDF